ncbi:uncharacterized protein KGF55_005156 [Candida pseudojiufengensis]|uniref:uncharacterized protein n=1 Tax=Candida pseudojiufengensis TaxID=497109 RepID=UPI002224933D|nr:uncharacterized protein KGF55_005156 [Candida pseudojiufengensis]KAI5959924.1 hypothetical protein KGF55_005156 [Candida pseudojiufengensis]
MNNLTNSELTLDESLKFILETIDHGKIIYTSKTITKLNKCLKTIQNNPKLKVYSEYNKLKSRCSLMTVFNYLNFIISDNIMTCHMDSLPLSIDKKFDFFKLPPVSKPEEFLESSDDYEKHEQLFQLQSDVLSLISGYINEEASSYNQITTTVIEKLVIIFHELTLSSLLSSLTCAQYYQSSYKNDIYTIIQKLLHITYTLVPTSKLWICLINIANDICYDDLRHIKLFIELFQDQIDRDNSILSNELVRGGLQYFIETFKPNHQWFEDYKQDETNQELNAGNFKFLYSKSIE